MLCRCGQDNASVPVHEAHDLSTEGASIGNHVKTKSKNICIEMRPDA